MQLNIAKVPNQLSEVVSGSDMKFTNMYIFTEEFATTSIGLYRILHDIGMYNSEDVWVPDTGIREATS